MASRFAHLATATLHCPDCNASLNVPKTQLGQSIDCPSCQHSFMAVEPPQKPDDDELALHSPHEEANAKAAEITMIDNCPACGKPWIKGEVACKKCLYNVVLMRRMKDFSHKGSCFRVDTTKIFLYLVAGGVAFGIYWLATNFQWLKGSGQEAFDNASQSKGPSESTPDKRNNPTSSQGKIKD